MPVFRRVPSLAVAACAVSLAATAACSHPAAEDHASTPTITVSVSQCGQGWRSPHTGQQQFALHNTDTRAGEAYLTDAKSGAVFAEVDPLGPGTSATMSVNLGSGQYAFRCAMDDAEVVVGPAVTVPGHVAQPVRPVLPVTQADLLTATRSYESYVTKQIPVLRRLTDTLATAVRRGDRTAAERAWMPAHLAYERLGAAYGAFGDLDGEINGLPSGLARGVNDPSWSGFHRLEYGLWHGAAMPSLATSAAALQKAVDELGATFAKAQLDPRELAIRAHEISENALQFELTGRTDFGSGSSLATVQANLAGTRVVYDIVRPLLTNRLTNLNEVDMSIARAEKVVGAVASKPLSSLTPTQRATVNAAIDDLTEKLAPVASVLEPRRGS